MASARRPPALVYGRNPVLEALRAGRGIKRLTVLSTARPEARLDEILELAEARRITVERTGDRRRLDDIAHTEAHQGVIAHVERRAYLSLPQLLEQVGSSHPALLLVLDGIQDPQNLGSLARSAEAAGVHGLIIGKNRSAEVTPAATKASAGAVEHLRICQVSSIPQAVASLQVAQFWVVGLAGDGRLEYAEAEYPDRTAVVVGSEGGGLHRLVRERCDEVVRLPMAGRVSSLNAAVAASIVLYEVGRQWRLRPKT